MIQHNTIKILFLLFTFWCGFAQVQLFDLSGQLVHDFSAEALQQKQFSVATIPNGTYIVQVKTKTSSFNLKLLVDH